MIIVPMKFSVTIALYKDSDFKGLTEVSWPIIYGKACILSRDGMACLKL